MDNGTRCTLFLHREQPSHRGQHRRESLAAVEVRVAMGLKVSPEESLYRRKHGVKIDNLKNLWCASCGIQLVLKETAIFSHPLLGTLQCKRCNDLYEGGELVVPKVAEARICYLCKKHKLSNRILTCSSANCPFTFCKLCIKRNVRNVECKGAKHWQCFLCNCKQLWEVRAICAAVQASLPKKNRQSKMSWEDSSETESTSNVSGSEIAKREIEHLKKSKQYRKNMLDNGNVRNVGGRFLKISVNSRSNKRRTMLERRKRNDGTGDSSSSEVGASIVKPESRDEWEKQTVTRSELMKIMKKCLVVRLHKETHADLRNRSKSLSNKRCRYAARASSKQERVIPSTSQILSRETTRQNGTSSSSSSSSSRCTVPARCEDDSNEEIRQNARAIRRTGARPNRSREMSILKSDSEEESEERSQQKSQMLPVNCRTRDRSRSSAASSSDIEFKKRSISKKKRMHHQPARLLDDINGDYSNRKNDQLPEHLKRKLEKLVENIPRHQESRLHDIIEEFYKNVMNSCKRSMSLRKTAYTDFRRTQDFTGLSDVSTTIFHCTNLIDNIKRNFEKDRNTLLRSYDDWSRASGVTNVFNGIDQNASKQQVEVNRGAEYRDGTNGGRTRDSVSPLLIGKDKKVTSSGAPNRKDNLSVSRHRRTEEEFSECDTEEIFSENETSKPLEQKAAKDDLNKNFCGKAFEVGRSHHSKGNNTSSETIVAEKMGLLDAASENSDKDSYDVENPTRVADETTKKNPRSDDDVESVIHNNATVSSLSQKVHVSENISGDSSFVETSEPEDHSYSRILKRKTLVERSIAQERSEVQVSAASSVLAKKVERSTATGRLSESGSSTGIGMTIGTDRYILNDTEVRDNTDMNSAKSTQPINAVTEKDNVKEMTSGFEEEPEKVGNDTNESGKSPSSTEEKDMRHVGVATEGKKELHEAADCDAEERNKIDDSLNLNLGKNMRKLSGMKSVMALRKREDRESSDEESTLPDEQGDSEVFARRQLLDSLSENSDEADKLRISEKMFLSSTSSVNRRSGEERSSDVDSTCSTVILADSIKDIGKSKQAVILAKGAATELEGNADSSKDEADLDSVERTESTVAAVPLKRKKFENQTDRLSDLHIDDGRAKEILLLSSSGSSDKDTTTVFSHDSGRTRSTSDTDSSRASVTSQDSLLRSSMLKKRKFKCQNNYWYSNDSRLRQRSFVLIERINEKDLEPYTRVLNESRRRLENKEYKRLFDLDSIERRAQDKRSDAEEKDQQEESAVFSKGLKDGRRRRQLNEEKEDTLLDHLNKVENGQVVSANDHESENYTNKESLGECNVISAKNAENRRFGDSDTIARALLLHSSSDSNSEMFELTQNENEHENDVCSSSQNSKTKKSKKKDEEHSSEDKEERKSKKERSAWRRSKVLRGRLSDSDSKEEDNKWRRSQKILEEKEKQGSSEDDSDVAERIKLKRKRTKRRLLGSDSDSDSRKFSKSSEDSNDSLQNRNSKKTEDDSEEKTKTEKKRLRGVSDSASSESIIEKKKRFKRRRIKAMASDSSDSGSMSNSQSSPGKSGRKNIRKLLKDNRVADNTKQAAKEEEERLKRIAERQKLYNEMYEIRLAGEERVEKLILDFDEETKQELVSVHKDLVKRLKPHQAQGIKFMWDACFESLARMKLNKGSGCIVAHCMGLGKSFQVVTLAHTLITHEEIGVKTIMVVCPLSTVLNWVNEFKIWLKDVNEGTDVRIFEMTRLKKNYERMRHLEQWQRRGGVLIIGYEMFRNLSNGGKRTRKNVKEAILKCMVDPGADLVVCDEGHLLKNEDTALSKAMRQVKTLRRIVLTGTPLQNNLKEYHCMVQFVKPNLLGTKKEFMNRFVNPITNGQFDDSTAADVKLMKKRAHVLHKMLEGSVQRFDYSVLMPFLPPKQEYVIFVKLTDVQIQLYQHYLDNFARKHRGAGGSLFADFQALQRIWTHPMVLRWNTEKMEKANEKRLSDSDTEGSLKDFIDDGSDSESSQSPSDSSDVQVIRDSGDEKREPRGNPIAEPEAKEDANADSSDWWCQFVKPEHFDDMRVSTKLSLLFGILKESEQIGDKVLVFSQSLFSLTLIEHFLRMIDDETQLGNNLDRLEGHTGNWSLGSDYFRLDGQTSPENRNNWCRRFNQSSNTRARLFLISTRAGGLGINLTAANRVIIFDASWNPSHDVQSIFRIYRFGQKKPCYVYRFLAYGTMEEKIYNRQVTKLSLSCRVVDEQQIERHYSNNDLAELYKFEPHGDKDKPTLNLPKDRLLADIFLKCKDSVENYHEHDSLLENKAEEELDEEERKQAWLEYEEEKKGKPPVSLASLNHQSNYYFQHQFNASQMGDYSNPLDQNKMMMRLDYENLQQLIRKDYPNLTEEQQKTITNRTILDMYNYLEKQAVHQLPANPMNMGYPTLDTVPRMGNMQGAIQQQMMYQQQMHQQRRQLLQHGNQQMNYAQQGNVGQLPRPEDVPGTSSSGDVEVIEASSASGLPRAIIAEVPRAVGEPSTSTNSNKSQEE
ncbi:transcriptional regulator ATRX isoform X1 [Cephus cinctus]|uniref:ATP-dependent helicase ATRX n=2 Tax=Cephus cinctus TaxID=211228 RepID=A0AAJ7FKC1_CEPCN|nr:transcriptional regulator ATRX isoform X1 [Cephus cinctus]